MCDALGNPLRFVLTAGQRHDSKPVPELLGGLRAKALLAVKAYDSDKHRYKRFCRIGIRTAGSFMLSFFLRRV